MSITAPIRVVIADEHPVVRRTLRVVLDQEPGCRVVAEAPDAAAVSRAVQDYSPHVVVLDLRLGGGRSLELVRELRQHAPGTAIVGVTMERSPSFARQALDSGVTGFVVKDHADAELPGAVRRAARGVRYASPCVAPGLERLRRPGAQGRARAGGVRARAPRTGDRPLAAP